MKTFKYLKPGDIVYDWNITNPSDMYRNKVISLTPNKIIGYTLWLKDHNGGSVMYDLTESELDKVWGKCGDWLFAIGIEGIIRCINENI